MNICVIGLGYVGTVTAACLASKGNSVIGVDLDEALVDGLNAGKSRFYEPGLHELLQSEVFSGRLRGTTSISDALSKAQVVIVSVGTPSAEDGSTDLNAIRGVVSSLKAHTLERLEPLTVVVTSTIAPGTTHLEITAELVSSEDRENSNVQVAFCPEFLREGSALDDFLRPELCAIGVYSESTFKQLSELYRSETCDPVRLTIEEAESVKFLSNAWHALKVSFANEAGRYLNTWGIDSQSVMNVFLQDKKLNISERYLRPGFSFGGSCLPKDVRSLEFQTRSRQVESPVFWSINRSNLDHLNFALAKVRTFAPKRVLLLGLAFKAKTSDLRESASLWLAKKLMEEQVELAVFDEHVSLETIKNLEGLAQVTVELSLTDALLKEWDLVIVGQANKSFNESLAISRSRILDLAGSAYSLQGLENYEGLTW